MHKEGDLYSVTRNDHRVDGLSQKAIEGLEIRGEGGNNTLNLEGEIPQSVRDSIQFENMNTVNGTDNENVDLGPTEAELRQAQGGIPSPQWKQV